MSTRCQVQVIEYDGNQNFKITLYHHTDGYPEYMIPKMFEAYSYRDQNRYSQDNEHWNFLRSRAGKIASLLCWSDPGVFEPEDHHTLHVDIDYFYRLYSRYLPRDKKALWEIEIFKRIWHDGFDENWSPDQMLKYLNTIIEHMQSGITIEDFSLIQKRQSIEKLMKKYI